jgi:hypothetical protein
VIQLKQPPDDGPVVVERLDYLHVHLLIMPRPIRAGAMPKEYSRARRALPGASAT